MESEQDEYLSEVGKVELDVLLEATERVRDNDTLLVPSTCEETDSQPKSSTTSKLILRNKEELQSFFGKDFGQDIYSYFLRSDLNVDWDSGIENSDGDMTFSASYEVEFKEKVWEVTKNFFASAEVLENCSGCDDARIWENPRNWSYEVTLMD